MKGCLLWFQDAEYQSFAIPINQHNELSLCIKCKPDRQLLAELDGTPPLADVLVKRNHNHNIKHYEIKQIVEVPKRSESKQREDLHNKGCCLLFDSDLQVACRGWGRSWNGSRDIFVTHACALPYVKKLLHSAMLELCLKFKTLCILQFSRQGEDYMQSLVRKSKKVRRKDVSSTNNSRTFMNTIITLV